MRNDVLVEFVACDAQIFCAHNAAKAEHRDVSCAAANVDNHRANRLFNREPDAERCGHRLLNNMHLARAGVVRRVFDRAYLNVGDARGHADDRARP
jgi:hypothetical protein